MLRVFVTLNLGKSLFHTNFIAAQLVSNVHDCTSCTVIMLCSLWAATLCVREGLKVSPDLQSVSSEEGSMEKIGGVGYMEVY